MARGVARGPRVQGCGAAGRGSRAGPWAAMGAARAVGAIRQQAAGDRRRGRGRLDVSRIAAGWIARRDGGQLRRRGQAAGSSSHARPHGRPGWRVQDRRRGSRQAAGGSTRAGMGDHGRGRGRRGSPPAKGQHVFISFGLDCFRRGSRAACPGAAGRRGSPPGPGPCPGAAGRRGRVHFDGRQGRGAHGQRGQDRAHAYTREHKTRVRPLPLKKIFLFPVGEYLARKTGGFPHGPFFCAMLFTSQGKRPAGDGGKPPKKFPEKNF